MTRRVAITGIGVISPLGNDVASTWQQLLKGHSGIAPIQQFEASHFPTTIAAEVKQAGNTKLQMPMNHPAFPLTASQLVELGVGYTNVAPQPPAILMKEMKNAVRETHKTLGRKT